ncbi:MAG: hypothetical protein ACLSAF_11310 [Intestinimonas sp.]
MSLRDYNALMAMQGKAPLAAAALPALSREPVPHGLRRLHRLAVVSG